MERIGVIGLGRMGSAIAQRLVAQGYSIAGWTRSGRAIEGVISAPDLPSLVASSDTLVLSLLDDAAVAFALDACLECDLDGKLIIETSTVVPKVLQDRFAAITGKGAAAVDAPISGGPELVAAGSCGVFIGGDDAHAKRAEAVIAGYSNRVFHVGPLGTGLVMKTINNSMIQLYFAGLRDMMPLAKRAGLPLETAMRILCGGPAGMPMAADRLPKILGEDKTVGFAMSAAAKDCDVFQRVVQSHGLESPALAVAKVGWDEVLAAGLGDEDPARQVSWAYENG
ncbi:NAD(P)-dependent oxidoreductase [Yoonia litorea]|uniref:3-hydroxyisobutyrate dehydrogenase n=1 Tax=Yoonia litorea TaxID=1123755 RepID=A0A1I6N230_9RHOB|nr:NAD(P)-dependent oxidoreductase [Yoonia litorea]SFS21921.1 3-hydroxyisobutyrate dehydrogenase [Yoonia litorea]